MNKLLTMALLFMATWLFGQDLSTTDGKFWIQLTDKKHNPYQLDRPETFLSPRAIARRHQQGISFDERDLPVSPTYLKQIRTKGVKILHTSKWLNGATVLMDSTQVMAIEAFDFVANVDFVGKVSRRQNAQLAALYDRPVEKDCEGNGTFYGLAQQQIELLNGHQLHDLGHRGKNKLIALLDGGFSNVLQLPFFDSLVQDQRLLVGHDFVQNDSVVYESSSHGTQVLSVMGANWPGRMVGTAPEASYVCIKTEDIYGEDLGEECNWIAGAEYADSIGADIINSSIGYTTFNDPRMNYEYQDLNGHTSLAAIAANIAFEKGILVVNSAGNSGGYPWKYIGVPADAEGVLAVGACDTAGNRLDFSSFGPTADGRLKPNVVALGEMVAIASVYSCKISFSDGTSFSAPLISGMAASLWSAFPEKTSQEIMEAIQQSAHLAKHPNSKQGYGMPDFHLAYQYLRTQYAPLRLQQDQFTIAPSVFNDGLELAYFSEDGKAIRIEIYNLMQDLQYQTILHSQKGQANNYVLNDLKELDKGYYHLMLNNGKKTYRFRLLKE